MYSVDDEEKCKQLKKFVPRVLRMLYRVRIVVSLYIFLEIFFINSFTNGSNSSRIWSMNETFND